LVLGAKEKNTKNLKIGDVEFFSKLNIEFLEENAKDEKLFVFNLQEKNLEYRPFIRAKIRRKGIDLFKIKDDAFKVVAQTIDFIKYRYASNERSSIKLSKAWAALDINRNLIRQIPDFSFKLSERYEPNDVLSIYNASVQITKEQGKEYGLNYSTLESNKIHVALEWINKAESSNYSYDTYFMNLWIALEYLVKEKNKSIFQSIMDSIPALISNKFLSEILDNLHKIHSIQIFMKRMVLNNIELAKEIGLYPIDNKSNYSWHPFEYGQKISKIIEWISDSYIRKRSEEVSIWYSNNNEFLNTIKSVNNRIRYDFNIMYKIRNSIVHTADSNNEYLGYYCIRLKETIDIILDMVIHELQYNGRKTIYEILGIQKIKYELYLEKIKSGDLSFV